MLFYFTSRIISSLAVFIYPGYASYKTLSQRPASEEELERWLMYWSVLGCVVGVEYVAEWLVSWIPFYYTVKTIFLLYLALPQTQGSSYLYLHHLQPFFRTHESQIDATLVQLKTKVYAFLQDRVRLLWEHVSSTVGAAQAAPPQQPGQPQQENTASGPAQLVSSLWTSFGPGILANGAALLRQGVAAAPTRPPPSSTAFNTPPTSYIRSPPSSQSLEERRRQLEAELAALSSESVPVPPANPSRDSSDSSLRERTNSSGKFEEIEVPSDVEGYDVGEVGIGHEAGRPGAQKRGSSWFGWGSGAGKGYERVKDE
ncbi:TB2/DP1, HVA22 family-domain-containing protein [Cyathus striatus]|nr:TB2/DP1, HVA22 family-domain-containing protein [Cyathus striatus]